MRNGRLTGRWVVVALLAGVAMAVPVTGGAAWGQTSPEEYIKTGEERYRRGEYDAAIAMYNLAIGSDGKSVVAYNNRGAAKHAKGDLKGAVEDYSKALEFDAKFTNAYYNRGRARLELHEADAAIADFSKVIEADGKFAPAYNFRGVAKSEKGDAAAAIADMDKAIELNPKFLEAFTDRGIVKRDSGKTEEALADFTRALELDQDDIGARESRAMTYYERREWMPAMRDFKTLGDLMPNAQEYQRFYIWIMGMRVGQKEAEVNKSLADYLEKRNTGRPRDWMARVGEFLLDKTTEADLITNAASKEPKTDRGQKCEAYYFAGIKRLLKNDKAGAAELFAKCVATEEKDFIEYRFARAELKALGK